MDGTEARDDASQWRFWVSDYEAILGVTIVLVVIGSLNIFSSSFVVAGTHYDDPYFFIRKQGINLVVGLVCFLIGAIDYHKLVMCRKVAFGLVLALLIAVYFAGVEVNGAQRWLSIGGFQLQPAELAKPTAIFLEAYYISWRVQHGMRCNLLHDEIYMIVAMAALVQVEPDMGTAMIILGIPLFMLFCSNMKKSTKMKLLLGGLAGGAILCVAQPYRLQRVRALLDPWMDAQGAGYQSVQSLQAIGSGGLFGMGMGAGISKYHYLPEAHTDFAFSVWCQEMGFIGAFVVLVLFVMLAYHGVRISARAKDALGQMLAFGMTMLLVGQAAINLLMISGCLPVVGVPLPFISYGGTSLFVSMFVVGVLFNIGLRNAKEAKAEKSARPKAQDFVRPRLRRVK
ncbi:MAG: rod shape-determining protein RodA [Schwartzia sp.]|nr:rod shape-determining protein RodA [Schwartzia sp. (in: firmicutes)]